MGKERFIQKPSKAKRLLGEIEPHVPITNKTYIPLRHLAAWKLTNNKSKALRLLAELNYYLIANAHARKPSDITHNEADSVAYSDGDELEIFLQAAIHKLKK